VKNKIVSQTMFNYSVVNRATGEAEIVKNVWFTFYHDRVVELFTSETNCTVYALADYDITRRG